MKPSLILILVLGIISAGCSSNKAATPNTPAQASASPSTASSDTNPDQPFLDNAGKGNRAEVELGNLVAAKSKNPSVKKFAQMMADDYADAQSKLQLVAQQKNLVVPDEMSDDAKALRTKLTKESGSKLDKDYMAAMVAGHQKGLEEFQEASKTIKDRDVKSWATATLPMIQKHMDQARHIDNQLELGKAKSEAPSGGN